MRIINIIISIKLYEQSFISTHYDVLIIIIIYNNIMYSLEQQTISNNSQLNAALVRGNSCDF